jgi:hypothetical protein
VFHKNGVKFSNGCQLSSYAYLGILQRNPGLDLAPAHGAGCVPEQPAVDARQVECVAAHRQAPRGFTGLELLRKQSSVETGSATQISEAKDLQVRALTWRQTEQETCSPPASTSSANLTTGSASMAALGMPLAPPVSKMSEPSPPRPTGCSTALICSSATVSRKKTCTGRREHVGTRTWLSTALSTAGSTFSRTRRPVSRLQMTPS